MLATIQVDLGRNGVLQSDIPHRYLLIEDVKSIIT